MPLAQWEFSDCAVILRSRSKRILWDREPRYIVKIYRVQYVFNKLCKNSYTFIAFQTECTTHHRRAMLGYCRCTHGTTDPPSSWSLARAFSVRDRDKRIICLFLSGACWNMRFYVNTIETNSIDSMCMPGCRFDVNNIVFFWLLHCIAVDRDQRPVGTVHCNADSWGTGISTACRSEHLQSHTWSSMGKARRSQFLHPKSQDTKAQVSSKGVGGNTCNQHCIILQQSHSIVDQEHLNMIREGTVNFCAYDCVTDQCTCADLANHGYSVVPWETSGYVNSNGNYCLRVVYLISMQHWKVGRMTPNSSLHHHPTASSSHRDKRILQKRPQLTEYISLLLNLHSSPSPLTHHPLMYPTTLYPSTCNLSAPPTTLSQSTFQNWTMIGAAKWSKIRSHDHT